MELSLKGILLLEYTFFNTAKGFADILVGYSIDCRAIEFSLSLPG